MDFIFTSLSIRRIFYLLLVICLALFSAQFFSYTNQYVWLIGMALALGLMSPGNKLGLSVMIVLVTGLSTVLAVGLMTLSLPIFYIAAIFIFITTFLCVWVGQCYPIYRLPAFIINFFVLLSAGLPLASLSQGLNRMALMWVGIAIVIICYIILWPFFKKNVLQWSIAKVLRNLLQLNNEIFSCFLQPEYPNNLYLFERRLQLQKDQCLTASKKIYTLYQSLEPSLSEDKRQALLDSILKLNLLYDMMLEYSILRWRVTDHSTFAVCEAELKGIQEEINALFVESMQTMISKKYQLHSSSLTEKINKFEDNYNHVLQVASREPLVFLLFISTLKHFDEEIKKIREALLRVRVRFLWPI